MDRERKNFKHDSDNSKSSANRLPDWIEKDLKNSGLTIKDFPVEPLISERQLEDRLGFTTIGNHKILNIGGYWITYPNVQGYYRLKLKQIIETQNGNVKYLSPKGSGNHAYVLPSVEKLLENYNPDTPIFIAEGEKKAAKATLEGYPCIGLSGVWNFKDSESHFLTELDGFIWKDRTTYIVYDSDISEKHSVKHAELRLAVEFINRCAKVYSIRLPSELGGEKNGLDDYLVRYDAEAFQELTEQAKPTLELHIAEGTDSNLIFKEISRIDNEIMKAKILKLIAKREGVKIDMVQAEYRKHASNKEPEAKDISENFTDVEITQARELLNSPDILSSMLKLTKRMSFTGEGINQKLLYLAFTSRLMNNSISTIVKGPSSTGKSYLVNTITRLFPVEDVLAFSYISAKSLIHRQGDLSHKILYIAEDMGSDGADYSIRTLLSEKEISILTSVKNEITGNWEGVEKRIPAEGMVFVETTTRDHVNAENQTRLFDLYVDNDPVQTKNILEIQAAQIEREAPELVSEIRIWRAAQTIIESHNVYIPYAHELAEAFPKEKARSRRDFPRLLSLIRSHALLHQFTRRMGADGRLIATIEDLAMVLPIVEKVLADSLRELSPKHMKVLKVINSNRVSQEFSIGKLFEQASNIVSYKTLQRYVMLFVSEGIISWNGESGVKSRYIKSQHSGEVMSSSIQFIFNMRKLLENNRQTSGHDEISPYDPMSLPKERSGLKDTLGHSEVSSSKPSNIKQLDGTNGDQDIGTPEFRTLESLDDEFEIPGVISDDNDDSPQDIQKKIDDFMEGVE